MNEDTIKRINELYHLSKERPLTEEELKEQGMLRSEYISAIRSSIKGQLSNVSIVEKNGDIHPLESLKEQKTKIRKTCLDKRKEISDERFKEAGENLKNAILKLVKEKGIENVLLYASKDGEIPTDPLFEALVNMAETVAGPSVYYPLVVWDNLEFYRVSDLSELKVGNFGVREPAPDIRTQDGEPNENAGEDAQGNKYSPNLKNVLILLPGLSFDQRGHRIGYGKGFYDAFLSGLPSEADLITVGACMKECMAENLPGLPGGKLPCEKHDKKADIVIIV